MTYRAAQASAANKRREPRIPANIPALLLSYRRQREVNIVDISANGAMVRGDDVPEPGDEVVMMRDGIEVVATVAWAIPPHCGLSFHRMIDPHALLRTRAG